MDPNQKSHAVRSAAQCANNADIRHHPCVWLIFEYVYFERLIPRCNRQLWYPMDS